MSDAHVTTDFLDAAVRALALHGTSAVVCACTFGSCSVDLLALAYRFAMMLNPSMPTGMADGFAVPPGPVFSLWQVLREVPVVYFMKLAWSWGLAFLVVAAFLFSKRRFMPSLDAVGRGRQCMGTYIRGSRRNPGRNVCMFLCACA
jgi:hypothetical protein